MNTPFRCNSCNRVYTGRVKLLPFHCTCGNVIESLEYFEFGAAIKQDLPCLYRGKALREINCGCSGKPKIYACEKHTEAYLRKLPKMTKEQLEGCTMCLDCEDRAMYRSGDVGIYSVVYNAVGGTETYWKALNKMIGLAGMAVSSAPRSSIADFPVYGGTEAIEELCQSVKVLLIWGVTGKDKITQGPKRVAIHHGSMRSTWANSVFKDQLKWCEDAIAINEEVAKHYGVRYIPNVVDFEPMPKKPKQDEDKIVLWLHRDASEKRPELARRIAKSLPEGWRMVATMGVERADKKITAIGQTREVAKHLSHADVFLSTADQEGFGLSVAEAMLAGVPVVSSPHGLGANSDIVEQVSSTDISEWVAAILKAGSKAQVAKEFIEKNYSPAKVKLVWQEALSEWLK